jgi:DNA-binding transcriptional LysR family regulator
MPGSVNGPADPPHRARAILGAAAGRSEITESREPDPTLLERTGTHAVSTITTKDGTEGLPGSGGVTPQGVELRHLRYLVALADAGTFTRAAEQMFIAQPTLSQQIRRLEEMVGTPLLQRRREGLRLTTAGSVLLEESRAVLSRVDQGVSRTRQAAGLGRARLRFVMPPSLPEDLAVDVASRLRCTAEDADVDMAWLERPLDTEFSLIQQRHADAGLGWLTTGPEALPAPLDVMILGEFEPEVWIPATHPAAGRGTISLGELAAMTVIYGPRRTEPVTYDAWTTTLRAVQPRLDLTDSPFRHSLPMTLAFAATGDRPTAVLTSPQHRVRDWAGPAGPDPATDPAGMVRARMEGSSLTAVAALVWSGDLPRLLQQVLFDTADSIAG